jgi:hypothetical protein
MQHKPRDLLACKYVNTWSLSASPILKKRWICRELYQISWSFFLCALFCFVVCHLQSLPACIRVMQTLTPKVLDLFLVVTVLTKAIKHLLGGQLPVVVLHDAVTIGKELESGCVQARRRLDINVQMQRYPVVTCTQTLSAFSKRLFSWLFCLFSWLCWASAAAFCPASEIVSHSLGLRLPLLSSSKWANFSLIMSMYICIFAFSTSPRLCTFTCARPLYSGLIYHTAKSGKIVVVFDCDAIHKDTISMTRRGKRNITFLEQNSWMQQILRLRVRCHFKKA